LTREYRIVCVDDDEQFLSSLEGSLPRRIEALCPDFRCGFDFAASAEELDELLSEGGPLDMVISDQMMPGLSGIDLIERLKADQPDVVTVLLTGHGSLDSAKYAINRRLLDQYVSKPIEDIDVFVSVIANLLKRHHYDLEERNRTEQLARTVVQLQTINEQIAAMQAAAEEIAMFSRSLKTLNPDEVLSLASREVPRIFRAKRAVLCFAPEGCRQRTVQRRDCPCPEDELESRDDVREAERSGQARSGQVPETCAKLGGKSPDVVIPLTLVGPDAGDDDARDRQGYLCICDIDPAGARSPELIKYKAELTGELLGASLTNARLYQQAKRDSEIDFLTGTGTRRVLEEKLDMERQRSLRYGHSFSVVMIDVDSFKTVNDEFGHIAADLLLHKLTQAICQEVRQTDYLARYGGDEFVVLMPETAVDDAVAAAERIHRKAGRVLAPSGQALTVSCGVAGWSGEQSESGTDVLRRADAALREAKSRGRDQVRVEDTLPSRAGTGA
jgi:diguanylate cyclase (GGDEF)-like protein